MLLNIKPMTNSDANRAIKDWHRHNDPLPDLHISFCYGLYEYVRDCNAGTGHSTLLGAAIVGNPCGRPTGPDRKLILEVRRVCFNPDVKFHKLRRYYTDKVHSTEMSLRKVPVLVQNIDGTQPFAQGNAINAYTIPSYFLRVAEFYVQQKYSNIKKLWTYIQETEDGKYITEAGYYPDHYVKSRGPRHTAKIRFTKVL
jgi:hypothetical protein